MPVPLLRRNLSYGLCVSCPLKRRDGARPPCKRWNNGTIVCVDHPDLSHRPQPIPPRED